MTPSHLKHSSSTLSPESFDEDDEEREGNYREEEENSSPNTGQGKEKIPPKNNCSSGVGRFSCLSRKGFIIGLPKVPDTRFKSHDFAARIRCKISGKGCKRPGFTFIPNEALGNTSISAHKGGVNGSFKAYEPGSPDVSCVGRIKKKQKEVKKLKSLKSAHREDRQTGKPQRNGRVSWFKKLFNLGGRKVEAAAVLPDSRGAPSDNPHNVRENVEKDESSRDFVPRLSNLKRFASQREPASLSNVFFQDTDAREQQQTAAESGDTASVRVIETNFSEESEISRKLCVDSKTAAEEDLKKETAEIDRDSNCSLFDTNGTEGLSRTPQCEINLWKRRSVAAPRALELITNPCYLDMRKRPLTV